MKIGVIGLGIVGSTVKTGMEKLGYDVISHDIKHETSIEDVKETELCYICVPTPSTESGKCDTSIVESVVEELNQMDYAGVIAIKSTIIPGTTDRIQKSYPKSEICFVPEFLKERSAVADFTMYHDVCIIGTDDDKTFELVKKSHGYYPKKFVKTTSIEAEFCKYFNNAYNATLVTLANSFYELCKASKVDYNNVKNAITNREHIINIYLDCNKNFRGFGGMCLPKDTEAIDMLCRELNIDVKFFRYLLNENKKYKTTVLDGMRIE